MDTRYYKTFEEIVKVRVDFNANKSYSKIDGKKETELPAGSKIEADAILANEQITKEEYDK